VKLAWATDIHLNFLESTEVEQWARTLTAWPVDAVILTGDLAEAPDLCDQLSVLANEWSRPIYFVLGNHDYYRGSFAEVHTRVRALCASNPLLTWLDDVDVVPLTETTGLIGHQGWSDCRLGDVEGSGVFMNDWRLIEDLRLAFGEGGDGLRNTLRSLGDAAAAHVKRVLPLALERFEHVLLATHYPPFADACWHEGKHSDDEWLPHLACAAVGDVLLDVVARHPGRHVTVLCGHTHSGGVCWPLPNLEVRTGRAEYSAPELQDPMVVR
jgi:predicted MPP superfamily phosphohydrolase